MNAWRKEQVNKSKSTELIFKGAFLQGAFLIPLQYLSRRDCLEGIHIP
ncbi:hypothetical protein A1Q_4436 [Vibrio campbellii HY01]|nr:hypothetical protein A1Q_4436 [Vibrio campbellii HY01]